MTDATPVKAKKTKVLIPTPNFPADAPVNKRYSWAKVETPITREEVVEWVAALRSGTYSRATGSLSNGSKGFCCLGVLAEEKGRLIIPSTYYSNIRFDNKDNGDTCYLRSGAKYAPSYLPVELQTRYATMNDRLNGSFAKIAATIEKDFGLA